MKNILLKMKEECTFFEAKTVDEGIAAAEDINLDLIIIDMDTQEYDGVTLLKKIAMSGLADRVLLFSGSVDYNIARRAYDMNIGAFVHKHTDKEIIISVIHILFAGGRYFSPDIITGSPVTGSKREPLDSHEIANNVQLTMPDNRPLLSDRQREVLKLLSEGKSNKVIARELDIATGTVKVHIAGILKSLKAKNRTQAVSIATHINIL